MEQLGKLHPLLVHLPIGILLFGYGLLLWQRFKKVEMQEAISMAFLVGSGTAILACVVGWILAQSGEYEEALVQKHQWAGILTAIVSLAAYLLPRLRFYLANLTVLVLTITGHWGGVLTHGEGYLWPIQAEVETEASVPTPLELEGVPLAKELTQGGSEVEEMKKIFPYRDQVVPILKKKCYSCHSATKLKGGLRLDTEAFIRKGGKKGAILVAGNPQESRLFSYLVLPLEHDDHMPPKGKVQLSRNEIATVYQWIAKGASFQEETVPMKAPSEASLTASTGFLVPLPPDLLLPPAAEDKASADPLVTSADKEEAILSQKIKPAAAELLASLADKKLRVDPIVQGQAYVSVNFVNVATYQPDLLDALKPLENRLVRLRLVGQPVKDQDLEKLKHFPNLTRLNLEQSTIGDEGLKHLAALPQLQYLNLYGTQVTDEGIVQLAQCKDLKVLYLWKTKVSEEGIARLQKTLPNLLIEHGGLRLMKPDSNRVP